MSQRDDWTKNHLIQSSLLDEFAPGSFRPGLTYLHASARSHPVIEWSRLQFIPDCLGVTEGEENGVFIIDDDES